MLTSVASALCVAIPVLAAGLVHVGVIRLGLLPGLALMPLDFGLSIGASTLFGKNKTLRGALVMPAASCACALVFTALCRGIGFFSRAMPPYEVAQPAVWGLLCGAGYVVGELPNSFLKRRLGIGPGKAASGALGPVLWIIDQVDSMLGVWIFLLPVWVPTAPVLLCMIGITLIIHPAVALLMVLLGLKARIG